jgi:hypothetical protein
MWRANLSFGAGCDFSDTFNLAHPPFTTSRVPLYARSLASSTRSQCQEVPLLSCPLRSFELAPTYTRLDLTLTHLLNGLPKFASEPGAYVDRDRAITGTFKQVQHLPGRQRCQMKKMAFAIPTRHGLRLELRTNPCGLTGSAKHSRTHTIAGSGHAICSNLHLVSIPTSVLTLHSSLHQSCSTQHGILCLQQSVQNLPLEFSILSR